MLLNSPFVNFLDSNVAFAGLGQLHTLEYDVEYDSPGTGSRRAIVANDRPPC